MANGITPFTPLRTKLSWYLYYLMPPYWYPYDPGYVYGPGYAYEPGYSYGPAPAPQACADSSYDQYGTRVPGPNCYSGQRQYPPPQQNYNSCLLYTSDAADEEDSVDLGGCRIIKK